MTRVFPSSAERRIETFRHTATLDLYTRHGAFWEAIVRIRAREQITAERGLPRDARQAHVYIPHDRNPQGHPGWHEDTHRAYQAWKMQLAHLHDLFVPDECRVHGTSFRSVDFWEGFFSACLLFDPAPDKLLDYADHPVPSYAAFREAFDDWATDEGDPPPDLDEPTMLAPPIHLVPETKKVIAAERARFDQVISALHDALEPKGIAVKELLEEIDFWSRDEPAAIDLALEHSRRPYIVVEPHTTEEDVRHAFRLLAAKLPRRPRGQTPARSPDRGPMRALV